MPALPLDPVVTFSALALVAVQWYGGEHKAPELQKEAVYGLTEVPPHYLHTPNTCHIQHRYDIAI
jgi:hypothetical protein